MKRITTDEPRTMTDRKGLVIWGCCGDLSEWVNGINDMLAQEDILRNGDTFKDWIGF